jgi:uncharacterized protein YgbK (DUF1537 family)
MPFLNPRKIARARFGILADDLTGACDVAGRLTSLGYRPMVSLRPTVTRALRRINEGVLVVNTRSRASSHDRAQALAGAAAEDLDRSGRRVIYLKMDSTLRGHWPVELARLDQILRPERVMVCPAFPPRGRTFRNGNLELPDYARREFRRSHLDGWSPSLRLQLKRELGYSPHLVRLDVVRRGRDAVRRAVQAARTRFIIFDATQERDLATIGKSFADSPMRILWAGSAGLARHVFPPLAKPERGASRTARRPWLLIEGSRQMISHEQFDRLKAETSALTVTFHPSASRVDQRRWLKAAMVALRSDTPVAVSASREFFSSLSEEFAHFLGRLLNACLRHRLLGGVFVSGGSTAEAVCDSLRARTLRIESEVRPGIPRGVLLDGRWPGLALITKAGGFGSADEVLQILREVTR